MTAQHRVSWTERKAAVLGSVDVKDLAEELGATLHATGREFKGECPVCGGGAFTVYDDRRRWRCFSACDKGGNAIDLVMHREEIEFVPALERLEGSAGLDGRRAWDPARTDKARAATAARRKADLERQANSLLRAGALWAAGRALRVNDPGWSYLADRGLDLPWLTARMAPDVLRHHPGVGHPAEYDPQARLYKRAWPALLARIGDARGGLAAVQTIWLDPATREAPADVRAALGIDRRIWRPGLDPAKRATGSWSGGVCRLFPVEPGKPLAIAEGVEKSLAYTQLYGVPCWAAMFAANFDGAAPILLDALRAPDAPSEVVFAVDINKPLVDKRTGRIKAPDGVSVEHARRGATRIREAGLQARIVKPAEGSDWSDMLLAHLAARRQVSA